MTTIGVEIYAHTTESKLPDPKQDELVAIFYSIYPKGNYEKIRGIIVKADRENGSFKEHANPKDHLKPHLQKVSDILIARDELTMIKLFVLVAICYDVDILWGHETQKYSIEYIRQRSAEKRF